MSLQDLGLCKSNQYNEIQASTCAKQPGRRLPVEGQEYTQLWQNVSFHVETNLRKPIDCLTRIKMQ
jgi:hypothetical protein